MSRPSRLLANRFDAFVSPQDLAAVLQISLKALLLQDKFGMSSFVLLQASYMPPRAPFHLQARELHHDIQGGCEPHAQIAISAWTKATGGIPSL